MALSRKRKSCSTYRAVIQRCMTVHGQLMQPASILHVSLPPIYACCHKKVVCHTGHGVRWAATWHTVFRMHTSVAEVSRPQRERQQAVYWQSTSGKTLHNFFPAFCRLLRKGEYWEIGAHVFPLVCLRTVSVLVEIA